MFPNFVEFNLTTQAEPEIVIHGIRNVAEPSGKPAILLLHGFPQSHHMWHKIGPELTAQFDVVIPDLRGYGQSSKPESITEYAKSRMANDFISVMDQLGYQSTFYVCAHDRGARVAHKLLVDHSSRVARAILIDICPTLAMYESTNFDFASRYFHWFLLIQQYPLPETMILGQPSALAGMFLGGTPTDGTGTFIAEAFDAYVRGLSDPSCVRAMCNDYRASATLDLEEARQDLAADRLNRVPLRVLWGGRGVIAALYDAVAEWKKVSTAGLDVSGLSIDSGHFVPEERPDEILQAIREFFL